MDAHLRALGTGPLHPFSTWTRDAGVPRVAAGVYTIWWHTADRPAHAAAGGFVYVGIAGKGKTAAEIEAKRRSDKGRWGLWSRLATHASGQRGSDQFSVYVADRIILPTLRPEQISAVAAGALSFDEHVRRYVREHLAFRWIETLDYELARPIETMLRRGQWEHGKPFLNPE